MGRNVPTNPPCFTVRPAAPGALHQWDLPPFPRFRNPFYPTVGYGFGTRGGLVKFLGFRRAGSHYRRKNRHGREKGTDPIC
jgi:hypothetical protein